MDRELYYLFALVLASLGTLISAVNMWIVLKDRLWKVSLFPHFVSGVDTHMRIFSVSHVGGESQWSKYRAAIGIYNQGGVSCVVQSVEVQKRNSVFSKYTEETIEGSYMPSEIPSVIPSKGYLIFYFNPNILNANKVSRIAIKFANGKVKKLKISRFYK